MNVINLLNDYMKDYYKEIIEKRALIAIEDGLKPIHRKILYSFHERGYTSNKSFVKSVISSGSVLRYHPHGDSSAYDAAVNMSCYMNNVPLLELHGGNRTIYGSSSSAPRYTELRTSKFSDIVLLDKVDRRYNSVNYVPNFDESLLEPEYLPAKFPVFLLNGTLGIAGGFMCSILPHSIKTICHITKMILEYPDTNLSTLLINLKPTFPTGGEIVNIAEVEKSYRTPSNIENKSSGKCIIRAKMEYVEKGNYIKIYEVPYYITTDKIVDDIKRCIKEKIIEDITAIKDFSAKGKIDIRVYIKRGSDENAIIAKLYSNTCCQNTIPIVNIMTHNGKIKIYNNVKEMLEDWIEFRIKTIKRIHNEEIKNLNYDKHIKEGLMKICSKSSNIDKLIKIVRDKTKTKEEIFVEVKETFDLSDKQTEYILVTKLINLSNVSIKDLEKEIKTLTIEINDEVEFMSSEKNIKKSIIQDLDMIEKTFGDKKYNGNDFTTTYSNINLDKKTIIEDSIEDEDFIMLLTKKGFLKKIKIDNKIKSQKRYGTGDGLGKFKEGDRPAFNFTANSKDYILLFTEDGWCYRYKTYELPTASKESIGKTVLGFTENKKVVSMLALTPEEFNDDNYAIITLSKNGKIKATPIQEFVSSFNKLIAVKLLENDSLKFVTYTSLLDITDKSIFITTKEGKVLRSELSNVPVRGRTTIGNDTFQQSVLDDINILSCEVVDNNQNVIFLYSNGLIKKCSINEFPSVNLRTKGVITGIKDNSTLVSCMSYTNENDIISVISNKKSINIRISEIPLVRRVAYGNRCKKLEENEKIVDGTIMSGEGIKEKEMLNKKK